MRISLLCSMLLLLMLTGCASKQDSATPSAQSNTAESTPDQPTIRRDTLAAALDLATEDNSILDDSEFDDASPISEEPISDPLEPWNRMWFSFNDAFILNVAKPVYQGYEAVTPDALRIGLSNAMRNLQAPIRILNSLLQLEFAQAMVEFGRFIVNSTAGGLGLAEIVKPEAALVPINLATANFSGTLTKWGVGEGIYIVWPFLGPSTARDSVGLAGDFASSVTFWVTDPIGPVHAWVGYGVGSVLQFNDTGNIIQGYEALTKSAVEPYTALRDAYIKLRRNIVLKQD